MMMMPNFSIDKAHLVQEVQDRYYYAHFVHEGSSVSWKLSFLPRFTKLIYVGVGNLNQS